MKESTKQMLRSLLEDELKHEYFEGGKGQRAVSLITAAKDFAKNSGLKISDIKFLEELENSLRNKKAED